MNCSDQIITYASYDDYGRNGPHDKYRHCFASYALGKETLGTCRLFPLKLLLDWANYPFGAAVDHDGGPKSAPRAASSGHGQKPWHVFALCAPQYFIGRRVRPQPPAQLLRGGAAFTFAAALGRGCA
jgi:hypothetical protein